MRYLTVLLVYACLAWADDARARNVVLFLADAGGLATLNAASIHAHQAPAKLYVHGMPHIALSKTSSASRCWVTDSAAGMTAIVTGQKTHNGVISQSSAAVRGKRARCLTAISIWTLPRSAPSMSFREIPTDSFLWWNPTSTRKKCCAGSET